MFVEHKNNNPLLKLSLIILGQFHAGDEYVHLLGKCKLIIYYQCSHIYI